MAEKKSLHSVCRWTFHQGAGGFVPGNIRPDWNADIFSTADFIRLVKDRIQPKLPDYVELGVEMHYDNEYNEKTADEIADACSSSGLYVAMVTPGAHVHWGYGGIASLDPNERKAAEDYGIRSVDIAYGPLKKAWHPDPAKSPTIVVWNGSFGYDLATIGIKRMYQNLKKSLASLAKYEEKKGGELYWGLEPKPNEGHPAMLLPTVASSILFWRKLEDEYGVSRAKKGANMEFGHTEMIGLDHIYDYVEQFDNNAIFHTHLNSQGYNDGLILGGPGKFDIDFGVRINGMNIAIAGLFQEAGYSRWKGHDMQARSYDSVDHAIDRVVRSILSWEACDKAAAELNSDKLLDHLASRNTAKAEDMMRHAVVAANKFFDEMYS